jgi:hypothetical protein
MSKLLEAQMAFSRDVARLLTYGIEQGFQFTFGEAQRTPEMQAIYVQRGSSKTSNSMHLKKLAVDLNVFKNGALCTREEIVPLGRFWESLAQENRWGGSWRGLIEAGKSSFVDSPHFERQG